MSFDRHKPLDSFSSVGEGQTANVALQPGVIYDALHLEYPYDATAGAEFQSAHITGVRLNLNGEDIIDCSGDDLISLEAYEGNATVNGYITISLRELIARTAEGDHATGLVTQKGDAVSLEVDISGTGASAVVTLAGFADTRPVPAGMKRTVIPKIRKFSFSSSVAGAFEITTLPKGANVIKRVHFQGSTIDHLTVERDDVKLFDLSKTRNEYLQGRYSRVPQTNTYTFDPILDGYAKAKVMNMNAASVVFRLNLTGAGSANALVESVHPERNAR